MPSSFGTALRVSVFGQSHSPAVGCVVEGLPAGMPVDQGALAAFVARRAPGNDPWGTPRKEPDAVRIVSGLNARGETCGAPLAALIENTNTRSQDYANIESVPRPGHADFTAWAKWHGAEDVPGGGHFSGRLTGPLCVAGGLALQWLATQDVRVGAHVAEVAGVADEPLDALADGRRMPALDPEAGERMVQAVMAAREARDTVGGIVECAATGMPAGAGSPMFDGIENVMARALFGIPSVKGVEFGRGFAAARLTGTQDNDPYEVRDGQCVPVSNNAGGILGGITTGAPLVWRMAVKPTASIAREQESVDLVAGTDAPLAVRGRHDPCIVPRAVPVAEAACALALLDALLEDGRFSCA